MIDLKNISKDKLKSILSKKITIYPKYFGNKIILKKFPDKTIFYKRCFQPICKIDYIVSDLYSKPINIINNNLSALIDGEFYFTYDYRNDVLYLDNNTNQELSLNNIITRKPIVFDYLVENELLNDFLCKRNIKLSKYFNTPNNCVSLIINNGVDEFIIDTNKNKIKNSLPNDHYYIVINEIISKLNIDDIKNTTINTTDDENDIYIKVIDDIFINHLDKSRMMLSSIDYNLPIEMKPEYKSKRHLLNEVVQNILDQDNDLFNFYILLLLLFKRDKLPKSFIIAEKNHIKFSEVINNLNEVMKYKLLVTNIVLR